MELLSHGAEQIVFCQISLLQKRNITLLTFCPLGYQASVALCLRTSSFRVSTLLESYCYKSWRFRLLGEPPPMEFVPWLSLLLRSRATLDYFFLLRVVCPSPGNTTHLWITVRFLPEFRSRHFWLSI
ncbi:MAG: hypothetical protein BWY02_00671 [bacterium ADurb.Bin157]|nr:MAG: hypothetical protein BWY02_00671 [bacterium ADurb.Bin157]